MQNSRAETKTTAAATTTNGRTWPTCGHTCTTSLFIVICEKFKLPERCPRRVTEEAGERRRGARWSGEQPSKCDSRCNSPAAVPKLYPTAGSPTQFGQFSLAGPVSKVQRFMGATVTSLNCAGSARAVYDYYAQDVALSNFNIRLLDSDTLTLTRPKASEGSA